MSYLMKFVCVALTTLSQRGGLINVAVQALCLVRGYKCQGTKTKYIFSSSHKGKQNFHVRKCMVINVHRHLNESVNNITLIYLLPHVSLLNDSNALRLWNSSTIGYNLPYAPCHLKYPK